MCSWNLTKDTTQKYWEVFSPDLSIKAYTNCKPTHREEEITFLIQCFTENGYNELQVRKVAEIAEIDEDLPTNKNWQRQPWKILQPTQQESHRHITLDTGIEPQSTKKLQESGLQDIAIYI